MVSHSAFLECVLGPVKLFQNQKASSLLVSPVRKTAHWTRTWGYRTVLWKERRVPDSVLRHAKVLRQTQGTVVVPVFKRNSAISVRESENSWFQVVWFQYFVDIHGSLNYLIFLPSQMDPDSPPLRYRPTELVNNNMLLQRYILEGIVTSSLLCLVDCSLWERLAAVSWGHSDGLVASCQQLRSAPHPEIILELQVICFICGHVPFLHPNMAFVFFPLISGYAKFVLCVSLKSLFW